VRVGRTALDREAIRLIEEHHPQIHFDWPQILNGEEEALPPEPPPRRAEREEPPRRRAERHDPPPRRPEREERPPAPPPPNPAAGPAEAAVLEEPAGAAHARLGPDGLARLRARYADLAANISRRPQVDPRLPELRERVERLNPDSWLTDDQVGRGLEEYEAVLASLRDVIGRRRRRKRSRSGSQIGGDPADRPPAGGSEPPRDDDGGDEGVEE
jgi:hypothetical protein